MPLRCLTFRHHEALFEDPFPEHSVLLFDPRVERSVDDIGDRLRLLDVGPRTADLIIVRGGGEDFAARVEEDLVLRELVGDTPLRVLAGSYDARDRMPALSRPAWAAEDEMEPPLEVLRECELLTYIKSSKALIRRRGCHYHLPAGSSHAEAFIRLADALDDHTDLVRLSDWLLPYVSAQTALIADTGTLLGLLTTLAYEAHLRFGWVCPIATLNEYPVRPGMIEDAIDRFRAQAWERLLFLISVSSSGSMAREFDAVPGIDAKVLVLCETAAEGREVPGVEHVARLPVHRWPIEDDGSCPECKNLQTLVIDPQTYEVWWTPTWRAERPDMEEARRNAEFWEAADRSGAVHLHVQWGTAEGSPTPSRHLAVALDVPQLLGDPDFRRRAVASLAAIPLADFVLIPRHPAAPALRDLVRAAHGLSDDRIVEIAVGELDPALVARLVQAQRIVIVDDVLISGATLIALRDRIYRAIQPDDRQIDVWGWVVVSRPASHAELDHVRRRFGAIPVQPGASVEFRFDTAHQVFLPSGNDCPWCAERHLLEDRLAGLEGDALAQAEDRHRKLVDTSGLEPPLLLSGDDGDLRTIGSFFGTLGSRAAFAAASGLAQHMKTSFQRDRAEGEVRVLDAPLIVQAFYDAILVAGLLRTLDQRDLRDPGRDAEIGRALGDNTHDYEVASLAELGLAAVRGKLPSGRVRTLLESRSSEAPIAMLLAMLDSA
jgi:hypothetical protein